MNGSKILFNLIKILLRVNNEENDKGYFMEVEVQYLEKSHELHNDLPFIPETLKIENVEKFVTNLHDKAEYVIQIRNLKHALNHGLVLKKVHKLIKFNQTAWLKPYIDMNTKLKQKKEKQEKQEKQRMRKKYRINKKRKSLLLEIPLLRT